MGMVINVHNAIKGLQQAVNERGDDYVYSPPTGHACLNWHRDSDEPGCIVGLALYRLGVPAELLRKYFAGGIVTISEDLASYGIEITTNAQTVFLFAQVVQDNKGNWGAAIAAARAAREHLGSGNE